MGRINFFSYALVFGVLAGVGITGPDPTRTPKHYEPFNPAQMQQQNGKFVQVRGMPSEFNYDKNIGSKLQVRIKDSPLFLAEAAGLGYTPEGRRFNNVSQEKQLIAYEALNNYLREGGKEPITLQGRLEDKVLKTHAVVINNVTYSLLIDVGWASQIQSAIKKL